MAEPTVLLSGLGIPESPRWHDGRLSFCNWIDRQVVAAGMDGTAEVILARDPRQPVNGLFHRLAARLPVPGRSWPFPSRSRASVGREPSRGPAVGPGKGRPSAPAQAGRRPRHRPAVSPGTGRP